ncbi:hypothetical protein NDU88_003705 [Pleurodeles waltl]|uniref:Uncharacterized protein n=1 Tax=Pleurodeles waltl TaxID=8319 RepID=A0AAV7WW23_PLEWA|nr:hypothetical protein NDU88_003705 [Pleurodeles waltl]
MLKSKYYHLVSWAGTQQDFGTGDVDSEKKLLGPILQKKEVSQWYWMLIQEEDDPLTLPEEKWKADMLELELIDIWQVCQHFGK